MSNEKIHSGREQVVFGTKKPKIIKSNPEDLYAYTAYIGPHKDIEVEQGDSAWIVNDKGVRVARGPIMVNSDKLCVVIRGYATYNSTCDYSAKSNLPYVNGCTSGQLIPAARLGDPTAQLLALPEHTREQAHHIHPTARVVYVIEGKGESVQGMKGDQRFKLKQGKVIILDKNVPHHFETKDSELTVIPIHIFSSTPMEKNHPMFNGTHSVEKI